MASEIERKWVAEQPPAADALGAGTPFRQGYVAIDGDVTVRVRISPTQAWLTVKGGGDGLDRTEVDLELDLPDAEELWNHTGDRQLEKTRHRIPVDEYTAEVDLFAGQLDGLCVVEVEFPTVERRGGVPRPGVVRARGHRAAGVEQRLAGPIRPALRVAARLDDLRSRVHRSGARRSAERSTVRAARRPAGGAAGSPSGRRRRPGCWRRRRRRRGAQ